MDNQERKEQLKKAVALIGHGRASLICKLPGDSDLLLQIAQDDWAKDKPKFEKKLKEAGIPF